MVTIDMKRIREALPDRAKVALKRTVSGDKTSLYIECIVRFPSLYEKGTKEEEKVVDQVFKWQEEIIGKENISEFYSEETGNHWMVYLKRQPIEFINTTEEDEKAFRTADNPELYCTEWRVGDKVKVIRQIGKNGIPTEVTGTIEKFSEMIRVKGEMTAWIKYDDGVESYTHRISTLQKA